MSWAVRPVGAFVVLVALCSAGCGDDAAPAAKAAATTTVAPTTPSTSTSSTTTTTTTSTTTATTTAPLATSATGGTCIGDSVMVRVGPAYFDALPMCGEVDAEVSRQMSDLPTAAGAAASSAPPFVVVHLGTNGTITQADLDTGLAALSGVPQVVIVTVQLGGSRSWEEPNNAIIRAAAERFDNVAVADWDAASEGQPGLLDDEYGHPTSEGAQLYAEVIAGAL